jgi:hypothetical protein
MSAMVGRPCGSVARCISSAPTATHRRLVKASAGIASLNDVAVMRQGVEESGRRPLVKSEWRTGSARDADTSTPGSSNQQMSAHGATTPFPHA